MSVELNSHETGHLNDDQFAAYAMGDTLDPAAMAHVLACESCRAEVEAFQHSVASFNTESLAWSKAQPAVSLRPLVRERKGQPAWAVASWALAGCVAVGAAISVGTYTAGHRSVENPKVTMLAAEDSAAQIERDNKLLAAVYEATSSRTQSPLEEYGLEAPSSAPGKALQRNGNE